MILCAIIDLVLSCHICPKGKVCINIKWPIATASTYLNLVEVGMFQNWPERDHKERLKLTERGLPFLTSSTQFSCFERPLLSSVSIVVSIM